jgi:hypothetical protein
MDMSKATDYAFPHEDSEYEGALDAGGHGLTKLEYFAGLAMQGILANCYGAFPANPMNRPSGNQVAEDAVTAARALITELERTAP